MAARGIYIVQEGEGGPVTRIETPESYRNRKTLSSSRSSSIKKLGRIANVKRRGFSRRPATQRDLRLYGPPIVVGNDETD